MIEEESPHVVPVPDELSRPFWEATARRQLMIQRCDRCNRFWHLPVLICATCRQSDRLVWHRVSGLGTVYSYIVIRESRAPAFSKKVPIIVACIELVEQAGLRMFSNLRGISPEAVEVGMKVEVEFEELEPGVVLPQFRPLSAASTKT